MIIIAGQSYRTGTTFTQRLLNCSNECLIFGEDNNILSNTDNALTMHANVLERSKKQFEQFKTNKNIFSANMMPPFLKVVNAYRQLFLNLYQRDFPGWGFKKITLNENDVKLVNYLFPGSKIVYCTRNIEDAIQSYLDIYPNFFKRPRLEEIYNSSIKVEDIEKYPNIIHFPYENINYESCSNLLDQLEILNKSNIESVLNLKLREIDNFNSEVTNAT